MVSILNMGGRQLNVKEGIPFLRTLPNQVVSAHQIENPSGAGKKTSCPTIRLNTFTIGPIDLKYNGTEIEITGNSPAKRVVFEISAAQEPTSSGNTAEIYFMRYINALIGRCNLNGSEASNVGRRRSNPTSGTVVLDQNWTVDIVNNQIDDATAILKGLLACDQKRFRFNKATSNQESFSCDIYRLSSGSSPAQEYHLEIKPGERSNEKGFNFILTSKNSLEINKQSIFFLNQNQVERLGTKTKKQIKILINQFMLDCLQAASSEAVADSDLQTVKSTYPFGIELESRDMETIDLLQSSVNNPEQSVGFASGRPSLGLLSFRFTNANDNGVRGINIPKESIHLDSDFLTFGLILYRGNQRSNLIPDLTIKVPVGLLEKLKNKGQKIVPTCLKRLIIEAEKHTKAMAAATPA